MANSTTVLHPKVVPYFLFLWMLNSFMAEGETYSHSPLGPFCNKISDLMPKDLWMRAERISLTALATHLVYVFFISNIDIIVKLIGVLYKRKGKFTTIE